MKVKNINHLLFISLILLTGCMVGKKYSKPEEPPSAISYRDTAFTDTSQLMSWLDLYKDTALQTMIKRTLDSNRDLLTAASRIEEAQARTAVIKANLWPQFGYTGTAGGGKAGTDAQKVAGGTQGGLFNAFGVLNWELDLWGKIRHAKNSAVAQYLSTIQDRNALQVSLIGEVASDYFLLRDLDNRLAIAQQALVSRHEYTRIITDRF